MSTDTTSVDRLLEQYGCGPVQFAGSDNGLYERHLLFDNVVALTAAGARERFEAVARAVRDVLSQRWIRTEETYERQNAKRIYYLSMEFRSEEHTSELQSRFDLVCRHLLEK